MLYEGRPADVITYIGYSAGHCGYCDGDKTFHAYGIWAYSLAPQTYKDLLDLGWRRSGQYLYRPNLRKACCKLYTIRLNPYHFKPTRPHRRAINSFNRWVLGKDWDEKYKAWQNSMEGKHITNGKDDTSKRKPQFKSPTFDLEAALSAPLSRNIPASLTPAHRFEIITEPASFSKEKFELYREYQVAIHHDAYAKITEAGFKRFLCESPIHPVPLPSREIPLDYASLHQRYLIDDKLIALAVLDVLPDCLSSVYLAYHPDFAHLSLGRISALYESQLSKSLPSAEPNGNSARYYMGYYVPNCIKMKYKGEYSPSELLDPECTEDGERVWFPIEKHRDVWTAREKEQLENGMDWYVSFVRPSEQGSGTVHGDDGPISLRKPQEKSNNCNDDIDDRHTDKEQKGEKNRKEEDEEKEDEEEAQEGDSEDDSPLPFPSSFSGHTPPTSPSSFHALLSQLPILDNGSLTLTTLSRNWRREKVRREAEVKEIWGVVGEDLMKRMVIAI